MVIFFLSFLLNPKSSTAEFLVLNEISLFLSGAWITALKTLPLASQETSAAMEFYHNQLKVRLLNEKDPGVYQRTDWLVDKLGTKVHSYFWLDEYSGKDDFARYWKDEWVSGLTCWRKALKILDSDVVIEGRCGKVTDQLDGDKVYVVQNPGSQFGICNCSWAEMGYLCEHLLKVIIVCRKKGSVKPSISLFQYNKALMDMLHCTPHDSLIRDHAISLAVSIQKQLNGLADFESSQISVASVEKQIVETNEQQTVGTVLADQDRELVDEGHSVNDDVSSQKEKNCGEELDASGGTANDLGGGLINQLVSANSLCGGTTEEEISYAKTDVEQSPIYISTPGLVSVDEIVSSDGFSKNEKRALISDAEISGYTHSKDAAVADQNEAEEGISDKDCHQDLDVEPFTIDMPPSTMEFLEQCTVSPQNGISSLDPQLPVLSNKADADSHSDRAPRPMYVHVESKVVGVSETSGIVEDNENEGGNAKADAAKSPCSTDFALALDRICDDATNNSNICHNANAVQSAMPSKSSRNHMSMPSDPENQQPVEVASQKIGSCSVPLGDNPSLNRCELKRNAQDGDCDNELTVTKKAKTENEPVKNC